MVLGWSGLRPAGPLPWRSLVTMAAAAVAAIQPTVRAGTVASVLTSACHCGPDLYSFKECACLKAASSFSSVKKMLTKLMTEYFHDNKVTEVQGISFCLR